MQFVKTQFFKSATLSVCLLLASPTAPRAKGAQETGQRFQVVVPPKITTRLTATRFQLQASVPVAMMTTVTKKSGSIKHETQILQLQKPQYNLSIAKMAGNVQSMVLTVCPL